SFERHGLAVGPHQAEITLATPDALPFDNARFATFEVRGSRKVLVIADEPAQSVILRAPLELLKEFSCDVRRPDEARQFGPRDLAPYQAVCLIDVAAPGSILWELLQAYVQAGGGVLVVPGGDELRPDSYNNDAAQRVLPGRFVKVLRALSRSGVEWAWQN